MPLFGKNRKKDNEDGEEDPTGIKGYIDKVILNPNLEQDLKVIGSPYKIPATPPLPEQNDSEDGKQHKPKK